MFPPGYDKQRVRKLSDALEHLGRNAPSKGDLRLQYYSGSWIPLPFSWWAKLSFLFLSSKFFLLGSDQLAPELELSRKSSISEGNLKRILHFFPFFPRFTADSFFETRRKRRSNSTRFPLTPFPLIDISGTCYSLPLFPSDTLLLARCMYQVPLTRWAWRRRSSLGHSHSLSSWYIAKAAGHSFLSTFSMRNDIPSLRCVLTYKGEKRICEKRMWEKENISVWKKNIFNIKRNSGRFSDLSFSLTERFAFHSFSSNDIWFLLSHFSRGRYQSGSDHTHCALCRTTHFQVRFERK